MNAERLAELMKLGLIQRKKEVLTALGRDTRWLRAGYYEDARSIVARADEVEEIEALLRSDLVKRAREILEAAK